MYSYDFYDTVRDGALRSAQALVPQLLNLFAPKTVVDVGCGEGWWARTFEDVGQCTVLGVDGSPNAGGALGGPQRGRFQLTDLSRPFGVGRHDLALCLEVGEHLPAAAADGLISSLCQAAPVVVWSAAIPGQGGAGHINEQWPDYWVDKFAANGFTVSGALRWLIWDDPGIENWYRQNLLVAVADVEDYPDLFVGAHTRPLPVVHPVLYDARRAQ